MKTKTFIEKYAILLKKTESETEFILDRFYKAIYDNIENEEIFLWGFGSFKLKLRRGRAGVNPRTLEKIWIEPTLTPKFKPGEAFKRRFNK